MKETIPSFYYCFSSSYLQWIGWSVSNTLYWCWAVSQGLLVRFSSCFNCLIRNCLLKKIRMTAHSPQAWELSSGYLKSACRFQIFLGFFQITLWAQVWDSPAWDAVIRWQCPMEGITWAGYTAPSETQIPLMNLRILGTPKCCHSLKESWYPSV